MPHPGEVETDTTAHGRVAVVFTGYRLQHRHHLFCGSGRDGVAFHRGYQADQPEAGDDAIAGLEARQTGIQGRYSRFTHSIGDQSQIALIFGKYLPRVIAG